MKVTQMPPVHVANLVAYSGNTAYGVESIIQAQFVIRSPKNHSGYLFCPN